MGVPKSGVMLPCIWCGKDVYRRPSELKKARVKDNVFCGQSCFHAFNRGRSRIRSRNMITCDNCGKNFHRTPAAADRKNNYCSRECSRKFLGRPVAPIGSTRIHETGYVHLRTERGWEAEHRVIMAAHLGRDLYDDETVHHRNGVRTDNRLENLELWASKHPKGQRVDDLVAWAKEFLARYSQDES